MSVTSLPGLDAEVQRLRELHHIPGFAVGLIHDGNSYVSTAGVTSSTDPLEVTPETLFHIGSTSKTLTATAIAILAEQGRLALDDLVTKHLPDLTMSDPDMLRSLTILMLLNHTSGFRGDKLADTGWGSDAVARGVTETVSSEPQMMPVGETVSYNNAAFLLAGRLIEAITGEDFDVAVKRLVLTPLGLTSTFFLPWEAANRRTAVGHHVTPEGVATPLPGWPLVRSSGPNGGAVSSVLDQLAYADFHLRGTTENPAPLSDAARLAMREPTVACRSTIDGVGVGWLLKTRRGTPLVTHGGNVSNLQLSSFALAPELGIAVTTLSNCRAGAEAGDAVLDWVLTHLADLPEPSAPTILPADPELVGRFDAGQWFQDVTLVDGKLFVQLNLPDDLEVSEEIRAVFTRPPTEVVVVGADLLAAAARPAETLGDFIRRADGSIGWLRWGMRVCAKLEKGS